MIRHGIAELWVISRKITGFFGFGAGLWIFGNSSGISGVRRRSSQGSGKACPIGLVVVGGRKVNSNMRVND